MRNQDIFNRDLEIRSLWKVLSPGKGRKREEKGWKVTPGFSGIR
jgi:hypothetical protein